MYNYQLILPIYINDYKEYLFSLLKSTVICSCFFCLHFKYYAIIRI